MKEFERQRRRNFIVVGSKPPACKEVHAPILSECDVHFLMSSVFETLYTAFAVDCKHFSICVSVIYLTRPLCFPLVSL